jgi:nucleotide-binding universal stress UspA family protein
MAFKELLVHIGAEPSAEVRLGLALSLAEVSGASVTGLHVIRPLDVQPYVMGPIPMEIIELDRNRRTEEAETARTQAVTLADRRGVGLEVRLEEGIPETVLQVHARYTDLVILGQGSEDDEGLLVGDVLIGSGRPVLVVPRVGNFNAPFRRIMIAWNGTREATRAVHDALPLLVAADRVDVVVFNSNQPGNGLPGQDIAKHLAHHGVTVNAIADTVPDLTIGEAILSRLTDLESDLLVMGGYGHSRLREFVFGGATSDVLRSMTVPTFMSH